ncbi:MAG: S1 family peptidase, partial [Myxococcales bacterium]|nr:S1 family peptidase [Myxococcales bacterium]
MRALALAAISLLVGCSDSTIDSRWGTPSLPPPVVEENPDPKPQPVITDGTADSAHPTVGMLASGTSRCTATLIGQRTVLTAGHCIHTTSVRFTLTQGSFNSSQIVVHPTYGGGNQDDLAVVILSRAPQGVSPTPLNTARPNLGQRVVLVGFGRTGETNNDYGQKRTGTNTVSQVTAETFSFSGPSNICNGDSGGPSFVTVNGQDRIAGVHSTKWGVCGNRGTDMRVDAYQQWIVSTANGDVAQPGATTPTPPPTPTPPTPPAPTAPVGEGERCDAASCDSGLACVRVLSSSGSLIGNYCMTQCQSLGSDAACNGGEVCTASSAGRICFDAQRPQDGYTSPGSATPPPTPPTPPAAPSRLTPPKPPTPPTPLTHPPPRTPP